MRAHTTRATGSPRPAVPTVTAEDSSGTSHAAGTAMPTRTTARPAQALASVAAGPAVAAVTAIAVGPAVAAPPTGSAEIARWVREVAGATAAAVAAVTAVAAVAAAGGAVPA
nr:hypothetical protein [Mycobacterium ulcerans]